MSNFTPISEEELEAKGYLLKEDALAIAKYAGTNQVMVTFRNTGTATLNQLKKGAAAKGHNILAKTIKAKTLGLKETASDAKLNACLLRAMDAPVESTPGMWELIGGFVANWSGQQPTQLYLTDLGTQEGNSRNWNPAFFKDHRDKKGSVRKVIHLKGAFDFLTQLSKDYKDTFPRFFYTGDYDMHDLTQTVGIASSIVASDSLGEGMIINNMNEAIYENLKVDKSSSQNHLRLDSMALTKDYSEREKQEYQVLRHGAQVSYLAHMAAEEPLEVIVYSLADHTQTGGELIAGYSNACKWNLIDPASGLQEWYDINKVRLKMTWVTNVHLIEQIARSITQQISSFIQKYDRSNVYAETWVRGAIVARVSAGPKELEAIINNVITNLTTGNGPVMRKVPGGYESTIPKQ